MFSSTEWTKIVAGRLTAMNSALLYLMVSPQYLLCLCSPFSSLSGLAGPECAKDGYAWQVALTLCVSDIIFLSSNVLIESCLIDDSDPH